MPAMLGLRSSRGALFLIRRCFFFRYASRIGEFLKHGRPDQLETALAAQKSFWRFTGMLTVVMPCLDVPLIFAAAVFGVLAAAGAERYE